MVNHATMVNISPGWAFHMFVYDMFSKSCEEQTNNQNNLSQTYINVNWSKDFNSANNENVANLVEINIPPLNSCLVK